MYTSINFLKERNRVQELTLIRERKIALVTSIILGVFLFVAIGLFSLQLFLGVQLRNLEAQTADQQRLLTGLNDVANTYIGVTKKLSTIKEVINKRGNKWSAITYFYSILPSGATINSVDLQADVASSLSFSIEAGNVFTYEQLSRVLQSPAVQGSGYNLDLGTLSRTKDGLYRMEITLTTKTAPAPKPATRGVTPK